MYYTYVLLSRKTRRRYTGSCQDLIDRLQYHNSGHVKSTRHGLPWQLVYAEEHATRAEAVLREQYFKTGTGRDEVDRLIRGGESVSIVNEVNRAVAQLG